MTPRRALWVLIAVTAGLRLALSAGLGLGNDESYHYLFTVHRDWSYFDHPPMLALVERLGIALAGGDASAFTLRLGFIALFAGSTWLMARLTTRFYGPHAGFLAALALNVTAYHTAAVGTFALPDGPLLFFWLLTLDALVRALESDAPRKLWPWLIVGLAWGGALLSKYHAIFLPMATGLYCLLEPSARHWLRRPGPYLALVIGLVLFSPVIGWNATHDWASFAFQGGRAIGELRFRPDALLGAILGQALYLFPWIWISLLVILFGRARALRRPDGVSPGERFLLCQAVVPLAMFMAVACTRSLLPHWTLVAYLSIFPMLGQAWAARPAKDGRRLVVVTALPLVFAAIVLLQTQTGIFQKGGHHTLSLLKVSRDPTLDLYGWDEVGRELERRGLLGQPHTFLFTSAWYYSGHLGFATRRSPTPVLCYNSWDARSFTFWSRPDDWVGQDGILVSLNGHSVEPHCFDRFFTRIESLGEFDVLRAGAPVRKVRFFRCVRQIEPFPFDGFQMPPAARAIARMPKRPTNPESRGR
jgi:hypothetical protein